MTDRPQRLRVNGTASIDRDDPLLGETVGAQLIVRVRAEAIFANCPRYIPDLEVEVSPSRNGEWHLPWTYRPRELLTAMGFLHTTLD